MSSEGGFQGCPLSTAFWCMGLHGVLVQTQGEHPDIVVKAYGDDIRAIGPRAPLRAFYDALGPRLAAIGLQIAPHKSRVFSFSGPVLEFADLGMPGSSSPSRGLMVCKAPIGYDLR